MLDACEHCDAEVAFGHDLCTDCLAQLEWWDNLTVDEKLIEYRSDREYQRDTHGD